MTSLVLSMGLTIFPLPVTTNSANGFNPHELAITALLPTWKPVKCFLFPNLPKCKSAHK